MADKPRLDDNGWEIPDPEPVSIPAGFKRPETLAEQVRRLVRTTVSQQADMEGDETFEEADDFDVDDDFDPSTPYETFFDPVLGRDISPQEFKDNEARFRAQYLEAQEAFFARVDRDQVLTENVLRARYQGQRGQSSPAQEPRRAPSERDSSKGAKRPPDSQSSDE